MIPKATSVLNLQYDVDVTTEPAKTYRLNLDASKIVGFADGLEAIRQFVYKVLNTERYEHLIYSWNYGVELEDLFGLPKTFVYPELKRRITEALMQDDRISEVSDFRFLKADHRSSVLVQFTVKSIFGEIEEEMVVRV